ncbi:hypothetical protein [Burkholderia ambifaria]|uniref:hypothetical protein n=1 Tax=Burkholderia ambifaria TaxID=152480 RepID=UPI001B9EB287|nr:hypothetical protein [Burkholderia ambifaria]MBR8256326.1 hypothetical protein [Burkholderia ambifaria]
MDNSAREQGLRDAIFEHGIFSAGEIANWKARPGNFRRHEAAWNFEAAEIDAETGRMQVEGLVACNDAGFRHALPAGFVACPFTFGAGSLCHVRERASRAPRYNRRG